LGNRIFSCIQRKNAHSGDPDFKINNFFMQYKVCWLPEQVKYFARILESSNLRDLPEAFQGKP